MIALSQDYIKKNVADSGIIFQRGIAIYNHGTFTLQEIDRENKNYAYIVDGNYGDYNTRISFSNGNLVTSCDCPYPGEGCKHIVAVLLDICDIESQWKKPQIPRPELALEPEEPLLTFDEIKQQALEDRESKARNENYTLIEGELFKGEHLVETANGRQYNVVLHDPIKGEGHCSCPDFRTNELSTCKHLIHVSNEIKKRKKFKTRIAREKFPFIDIYWDSELRVPRMFTELPKVKTREINTILSEYFNRNGSFVKSDLTDLMPLLTRLRSNKQTRFHDEILNRLDYCFQQKQLKELSQQQWSLPKKVESILYPYQKEGVTFSLFKKGVLIGDEMGLGKTLQAIILAVLKKELFGFTKTLIITLASLKEQWKREIEKFSEEEVTVVAGSAQQRQDIYTRDSSFFKITNYEAVLRDIMVIDRYKPDLIILDEAQRIKNFSTKTADAVKRIPKKHGIILTGTPLENKLEDVYSIIQFLDPYMLTPLWKFAANHFMLCRRRKNKILGYHNLDKLHEKLKTIVIRRKKEEVLQDLPEQIVNNYYIDLHDRQVKIHTGYLQALMPILNKKFLTPVDIRRIQELLLKMRMVCNSTYLIDRKTNISPKLNELEGILDELVVQNNRKMVIFSEWTTMTFLIGKYLSQAKIPFVELSGKIPVHKRQALIDEFTNNPDCKIFLSTEAGSTGLNLQAADCVVNFELAWNPAKMNQRIGRINRIGQKSKCVNVVNLISKNSIEEKILTGIQLKTDLFKGVFEGSTDSVEFSSEKRTEMLNQLRKIMGEEPVVSPYIASPSEDIPEDTPHYLNPQVLAEEDEQPLDITGEEEPLGEELQSQPEPPETKSDTMNTSDKAAESLLISQPPEKIETVLNSGMQFISGLLEVATGKKLSTVDSDDKLIKIDKETGEVTLKFKLPGF